MSEAMRGLVDEAQHEVDDQGGKGPILDLVRAAAGREVRSFSYGPAVALANALGENEVAGLLSETLEERK